MTLRLTGLTVRRGGRAVVDGVDLALEPGALTGLIGPNGAGKTTLIRAALGLLPHEGASDLARLSPRDRARRVAFLPQDRQVAWPIPVRRLVALGRIPWLPAGRTLGVEDARAVDAALDRMGLADLADRPATELSGGEQARVLIARVLAQETPVLVADEPVAGLDPAQQLIAMETFHDLARQGRTVLVSLHDLPLAARWCDRIVMLDRGRVAADGPPGEVLTPDRLRDVFGIAGRFEDTAAGALFHVLGRTG